MTKKLRKPEVVIPQILNGGKADLKNILPKQTTTARPASGRINIDTILLRSLK